MVFIMVTNWSTWSFWYYLLSYNSKYFKGNIYSNTALLGFADVWAVLTMRGIQIFFQTRTGFVISYVIVFIISWLYYTVMSSVVMVAIWVLLMRYGITSAFTFSYFGNAEFFQTDMVSTAFGIWNTFARMSTILSPMVTEIMEEPIIILTLLTAISGIVSWFLIKPKNVLDSTAESAYEAQYGINNQEERLPDIVRDFGCHENLEIQREEEKQTEGDHNESENNQSKKHIDEEVEFHDNKMVNLI